MKPILIIYGTREGHTRRIAEFIGKAIQRNGFLVQLTDARKSKLFNVKNYAGIIAGAPVHASRFPQEFSRAVAGAAPEFALVPTAFFSVCLGILQTDRPATIQAEKDLVSNFLFTTGWSPDMSTIFAGALQYSKYGFIKRILMKFLSKKAGVTTRTDRDYDFTNWNDVKRFADEFVELVKRSSAMNGDAFVLRRSIEVPTSV